VFAFIDETEAREVFPHPTPKKKPKQAMSIARKNENETAAFIE
jgi:hypothetical protein